MCSLWTVVQTCVRPSEAMLNLLRRPGSDRGVSGDRALLAFKLHRVISGAGHVYATLHPPGRRRITLDGQRYDPHDGTSRLYPTFFCRNCGQEFHSVIVSNDSGVQRVFPRPIDETPVEDEDSLDEAGYLMPEPEKEADYTFDGQQDG